MIARAAGVARRAELHPDAGHQRAVPVQQQFGAAAGAGPGWLFVFVPHGMKTGEFFIRNVVEAAVEVADAAEGSIGAYDVAPGERHARPLSGWSVTRTATIRPAVDQRQGGCTAGGWG
jgi:hypothetical protein